MKFIPSDDIERGRIRAGQLRSEMIDRCNGAFHVMGPKGAELVIIASDGTDPVARGWEHVSVSVKNRTPNWTEMAWVKNQFWSEEECVIEFHPPKDHYVNHHPFCLHLWRRRGSEFELPPMFLVGPKT